jgi:ketosteroid isomerase-like protein
MDDRQAITEVLIGYANALDARDWPALAELFTDDAEVDYSAEGGPVCRGAAEVVADCERDFEGLDATHHLIGNILVSVVGDTATASSLVQAWHHRKGTAGGSDFLLAGSYQDELVRHEGAWLIRRRRLLVSFLHGNPAVKAP